jgi:hypothetical protein
MLPYLIAGAIGYGIAKLFEEDEAPKYTDGGSILLAPNGNPSNLTPEQYKLVRTPEFKEWFGDWENDPANASKIVDENGEPLVVYHGSNMSFNEFSNKFNLRMSGFYFSNNTQNAKTYGDIITSFFLNIKKPLIIDAKGLSYTEDLSVKVLAKYPNEKEYETNLAIDLDEIVYMTKKGKRTNSFIEIKNHKKYDGNIFNNLIDPSLSSRKNIIQNTIVAFEPEQIKLADGRNTTFDGNNPDIRFNGGGKVLSYNEVLKKQQTGDYYFDFLFSNENSKFIEETIDIRELRELNGFSDDEDEIEHTISYFNDLGMDEDYEIGRKLMNKIVDGVELSPIVVDEEYKLLDGRHRLSAYSELYYYFGYDYPFDGKLKIYKRISN